MNDDIKLQGMILHDTIRVDKKVAKKWLLENKSVIFNGSIYFLAIVDLGLGVCAVRLRPLQKRSTQVVKVWDKII